MFMQFVFGCFVLKHPGVHVFVHVGLYPVYAFLPLSASLHADAENLC